MAGDLTDDDLDRIEIFLGLAERLLARHDIVVTVDDDLWRWLETAERYREVARFIYPGFDPRRYPPDTLLARWFRVQMGDETVAWTCQRLDVCDDYKRLLRDGSLWGGPDGAPPMPLGGFVDDPAMPPIRGRVAHGGAAVVRPPWRGNDVSGRRMTWYLTRIPRAMALRDWAIDWCTGLVDRGMVENGVQKRVYGYTSSTLFSTGMFEPVGREYEVYCNAINRSEMLDQLAVDTSALRREIDK